MAQSGPVCILPTTSRKFAQEVVNKLSQEQKDSLGINDNTLEGILGYIQDLVEKHVRMEQDEDKRTLMLRDHENFIRNLMDVLSKVGVPEQSVEKSKEKYNEALNSLGRYGKREFEKEEQEKARNMEMRLGAYADVVSYNITRRKDGTIASISYIVREPQQSDIALTAQQKAMQRLKNIQKQKTEFVSSEYSRDGELKYMTDKEAEEANKRAKKNNEKQWVKTGRVVRTYKGQRILVKGVTTDVSGYNPIFDGPVAAGPIGTMVDEVGRLFFDEDSALYDDDKNIVNDDRLQAIIDSTLKGVFTLQGLKNLIGDFQDLKQEIQKKWPGKLAFFTGNLELLSHEEGSEDWILGKPDLLVIDEQGIVHVMDFKTHIIHDIHGYENILHGTYDDAKKYGEQISRYIRQLESYGFRVDQKPYVILADTWYQVSDHGEMNYEENGELKEDRESIYSVEYKYGKLKSITVKGEEEGEQKTLAQVAQEQGLPDRNDVMDNGREIIYMEPRLHVKVKEDKDAGKITLSEELDALREDIPFNGKLSYEEQWNEFTEEEKEAMTWLRSRPQYKPLAQEPVSLPETDIASNPKLINIIEMRHMANAVMHRVSSYITQLQRGEKIQSFPTSWKTDPDTGEPLLKGKSRKDIIERVGLKNLIDKAAEYILDYDKDFPTEDEYDSDNYEHCSPDNPLGYVFENKTDFLEQKKMNDKREWLCSHRQQFIALGNAKLMALEDCVGLKEIEDAGFNPRTPNIQKESTEEVEHDTGDNASTMSMVDAYLEGVDDREAWVLGVRNYSPKASLAQEIRRLFESLVKKDDNGNIVEDPYGWGYDEYIDVTASIQEVLEKCKYCDTWEEIREALQQMATTSGNRWVADLLEELEKPGNKNLKTKFFRHFRKDALVYTIAEAKYDKETGEIITQTRIINTKSSLQVMLNSLGASLRRGELGFYNINGESVPTITRSSQDGFCTLGKIGNKSALYYIQEDLLALQRNREQLYKSFKQDKSLTPEERKQQLREYVSEQLNKKEYNGKTLIQSMTDILNAVGIKVTEDIVLKFCQKKLGAGTGAQSNLQELTAMVNKLVDQLATMGRKNSIPMALSGNDAYGNFKTILEKLSDSVTEHVEASVYQDGKTYYAYTNPSELGYIVRNLKNAMNDEEKFEEYMFKNYGRYKGWFKDEQGEWLCDWLRQLDDSGKEGRKAREALLHTVELSFKGTKYRDLGSLGFQLSILHNYFGTRDDRFKSGKKTDSDYRYFALPTMSNKPTNEYLRMLKYKGGSEEIVEKVLFPTFRQEANRIADVLHHFVNDAVTVDKLDLTYEALEDAGWTAEEIRELQNRIEKRSITAEDIVRLSQIESGAKFHFLWYLNLESNENTAFAEIIADRINLLLTPSNERGTLNSKTIDTQNKTIKDVIVSWMESIVDDEIARMREIGLFEKETKTIRRYNRKTGKTEEETVEVLKYQAEFGGLLGKVSDEAEKAGKDKYEEAEKAFENGLRDFVWQDIAANINIIQITGGDLALYGNPVNYQKRIAQIHSPGLHVMSDPEYDDGFFRSVHISDSKIRKETEASTRAILENDLDKHRDNMTAKEIQDYEAMINVIVGGISRTLSTDGQSYSSPTSMRKKLNSQGDWDDEHERAYQAISRGDFSINHLQVLMQPSKPFVTASLAKYSGSPTMAVRKVIVQEKNSEYLIVLAEALARGAGKRSKLKAICDFMEQSARENPRRGIDTVHFESVNKVGKSGIIDLDIFDADFEARLKRGETTEDKYNEELTAYMMSHIRRASKKTPSKGLAYKSVNEASSTRPTSPRGIAGTALNTGYREHIQDYDDYTAIVDLYSQGILGPEEIMYNPVYVDTISMNDYIIQQEVPAHLLDHQQLYGSQIRILGISDIAPMTNGEPTVFNVREEEMTAAELIDEYKELHATNIREGYKDLMEELGIDGLEYDPDKGVSLANLDNYPTKKRNEIYKKMSALLIKEIDKDEKYGDDYKRSLKLVYYPDGNVKDFVVPLCEPSQSKRIQQLLNSIIRKSINKQKIKGGPLVQTTAYDANLHIKFQDPEGNILPTFDEYGKTEKEYKDFLKQKHASIAYFECYMPVPDSNLEKMITKADGTLMSAKEAEEALGPEVWKSFSEVIGYRIPTEDKYSMIPMKIVGFLPKVAGQVVMLPQEITYLTGSDFDIDKMYTMLKSFHVNKIEKERPIDVYNEYLAEKGLPRYKTLEEGKKILETVESAMDLWEKLATTKDVKWKDSYITVTDAMKRSELEDFMHWYQRRMLGKMFTEYQDQESKNRRDARQARNNRLIDLQWAVLTHEDTAPKIVNPGNFNEQKKWGRIIRILKSNSVDPSTGEKWKLERLEEMSIKQLDAIAEGAVHHSITLPSSKIYFQRQNMQGTQLVGLFANHNVSHAFCSFQKIGIDLTKDISNSKVFWMDGHEIGNPENMIFMDEQYGFNGQLISKTIASFLAASVDTAKDPVVSDLNINTFTGGVAMTLARMGFDTSFIGMFLSQPIIMKLTNMYYQNSNDRYYDGTMAIKEMAVLMEMTDEELNDNSSINESDVLTRENLLADIDNDLFMEEEGDSFQRRVLRAFHTLFNMSKNVSDLTFCTKFNSTSNAVGPTISDTIEDLSKVRAFFDDMESTCFYIPASDKVTVVDSNGEIVKPTDPKDIIDNDPILKAFFNTTVNGTENNDTDGGASELIFRLFFPHYYQGFKNVVDKFSKEYLKRGKISAKMHGQLLDAYLYYLLTYEEQIVGEKEKVLEHFKPVIPTDQKAVQRLVRGIIEDFKKVKEIKLSNPNMLLDSRIGSSCLFIREADEFLDMDTLVFNSGQLDATGQQNVKDAWTELITMSDPKLTEDENNMIRRFGVDLFFYSLMRNGFTFSPKTLMHLGSVIVKMNATYAEGFLNYIEGVRDLEARDTRLTRDPLKDSSFLEDGAIENSEDMEETTPVSHAENICNQFMRNHANNGALVPVLSNDSEMISSESDVENVIIEVPAKEAYKLGRISLSKDNPCKFITVIQKVRDKKGKSKNVRMLYQLEGELNKGKSVYTISYKRVEALGIPNSFVEYDANSTLEHSMFTTIRNDSEDALQDEVDEDQGERTRSSSSSEDISTELNQLTRILVELDGPYAGKKDKDAREIRKEIREAIKTSEKSSKTYTLFKEIIKKGKTKEEQQTMASEMYEEIKHKCKK